MHDELIETLSLREEAVAAREDAVGKREAAVGKREGAVLRRESRTEVEHTTAIETGIKGLERLIDERLPEPLAVSPVPDAPAAVNDAAATTPEVVEPAAPSPEPVGGSDPGVVAEVTPEGASANGSALPAHPRGDESDPEPLEDAESDPGPHGDPDVREEPLEDADAHGGPREDADAPEEPLEDADAPPSSAGRNRSWLTDVSAAAPAEVDAVAEAAVGVPAAVAADAAPGIDTATFNSRYPRAPPQSVTMRQRSTRSRAQRSRTRPRSPLASGGS